jgi:hypothetical protein
VRPKVAHCRKGRVSDKRRTEKPLHIAFHYMSHSNLDSSTQAFPWPEKRRVARFFATFHGSGAQGSQRVRAHAQIEKCNP